MITSFIFRILSTLTICFATVATPLLVRTLVDGIIPTKDIPSIGWTLLILAINEILNIFTQYYLNIDLDQEEISTLKNTRSAIVTQIFNKHRVDIDQNKFLDIWTTDLPKFIYQKKKAPWFRIKDGLMIFLLSLICINISYLAGLIVLGVFVVILLNTIFAHKAQVSIYSKNANVKELERNFFTYLSSNFDAVNDLNKLPEFSLKMDLMLNELREVKLLQGNQRSLQQRLNAFLRFFMIFGVLSIGSVMYAQNELSMGSLWSLIITIYRLNGPLQNYSRWFASIGSEKGLSERVEKFFDSIAKQSFEKPSYFNKISSILDETVNLKNKYMIILDERIQLSEFKEAVRFWKSRSSKKDRILILDNDQESDPELINIRFVTHNGKVDGHMIIVSKSQVIPKTLDHIIIQI